MTKLRRKKPKHNVTSRMSERDFSTLYGELGARAFSDMAAEMSGVGAIVIKKRCLRAKVYVPKPKMVKVDKPNVLEAVKHYAIGTVLHVSYNGAIVMAKLLRYSSKGNLVLQRLESVGRDIVVSRKDVICEGLVD